MKKNYPSIFSFLFILGILFLVFYSMVPQDIEEKDTPLSEFSTKRALEKVKKISQKPHYVGTKNHDEVASYLYEELRKMGLKPSFQEGFTLSDGGTLVKSKNVLARIKGTEKTKALLLLSHYDSAPHSKSLGASDDASGVATILESVRALLHSQKKHKNDIVILFTDAEEIGLNGAALFVTKHQWAKEVGLVINFEARGTSGPAYMLMETNQGNAKMITAFSQKNSKHTVSNSLMYSIYKMLPNDTDLTVFREQGKIQGFNFAFIDNHFNYHTAQDNYLNLDKRSIAHQGSNLMALLDHFSNADLSDFNSTEEEIYFNIPYGFIHYSFNWIFPLLLLTTLLFIGFVFLGKAKLLFQNQAIFSAFFPLLGSLLVSGLLAFFGWKMVLKTYPQYNDIQQGFTYNGHEYIYAFVCLTLAVCFLFYQDNPKKHLEYTKLIAPLFLWLVINTIIAFKLKGAGFFIIPTLSSTLMLGYYVMTQKSHLFLNLMLSIPVLFILPPFIQMFPIGLGLKVLVGSAILTVLTFVLLLPVFGSFSRKKGWAGLFFILAASFFFKAHQSADYLREKAKPNSLVYLLNTDKNKAYWVTYDKTLDEWTKGYLGEKPADAARLNKNKMYSKYNSNFTHMAEAPLKKMAAPTIYFIKDSVIGGMRNLKISIKPNRKVNRYDVFSNGNTVTNFKANGVTSIDLKSKISGSGKNKIVTYYVVNNIPLEMEFTIPNREKLNMELKESSFDLLTNPLFSMAKRRDWMIPAPFVLNDAIVVEQSIKPSVKLDTIKQVSINTNGSN